MDPSPPAAKNVLLTGPPGCGKTTVVSRVIERLAPLRLCGFFTRELREHGRRCGFQAVGLGGSSVVLAHVDFGGRHRVGRYGVDLVALEKLIRAEFAESMATMDVCVIDEIGKMECLSHAFVELARRILDGPVPVLATIAARGGGFIREVKARSDIELISVSPTQRDELPEAIARRFLRNGGR